MKKAFAVLGFSVILALSSPSSGNALPKELDPFLSPPYPAASIFAVLMPWREECRIALLRNGTSSYPFPGDATNSIRDLVYLILGTKVHLKDGNTVPLSFYFPKTPVWSFVIASESLPLSCDQLSHVEVLSASCRLRGYDSEEKRRLTAILDVCAPDLPRRLDFFLIWNLGRFLLGLKNDPHGLQAFTSKVCGKNGTGDRSAFRRRHCRRVDD